VNVFLPHSTQRSQSARSSLSTPGRPNRIRGARRPAIPVGGYDEEADHNRRCVTSADRADPTHGVRHPELSGNVLQLCGCPREAVPAELGRELFDDQYQRPSLQAGGRKYLQLPGRPINPDHHLRLLHASAVDLLPKLSRFDLRGV